MIQTGVRFLPFSDVLPDHRSLFGSDSTQYYAWQIFQIARPVRILLPHPVARSLGGPRNQHSLQQSIKRRHSAPFEPIRNLLHRGFAAQTCRSGPNFILTWI